MLGFEFLQRRDLSLFSATSRPVFVSISNGCLGVISPGVNRPGSAAVHSSPSGAEVKNDGAIPPFSHMPSWRGA
jgi:hypothetical protein